MRKLISLGLLFSILLVAVLRLEAEPLIRPGDRIVFVGDSITGFGGNDRQDGWVALIGKALKEQNPANHQILVPLGGSGQTVSSWANVELKSRTTPSFLDVKGIDVQAELNQHADVVVIMLGMNDVLSPRLKDESEGYRQWVDDYRSLIAALRTRTTPRIIALGTPTPCTEDMDAPKNRVMDKMVDEMRKLAAEEKCLVLPTRAAAAEVLAAGRRIKPDFHINVDQVHPNKFGHVAIAAGMLRGFGEEAVAKALVLKSISKVGNQSGEPPLSYAVTPVPSNQGGGGLQFRVQVFSSAANIKFDLPAGWTVKPGAKSGPGESVFWLNGTLDRLINRIVLRAGSETRDILIPAPWLVGTGNIGWLGWKSGVYDREAGRLPVDEAVRTGNGLTLATGTMELKAGVPVLWKPFVGGVNYGGSGAPETIDFAGIVYFGGGEIGYGLRWIQSDRARPVVFNISRAGFAGNSHLEVWLNGKDIYSGDPQKARGREFPSTLKAGWNLLSFKSNFQQWQWQFSIALQPVAGDSLDALRYSIVPR